ncbi:GNAT family N-acetyltransferase [Paenibacillus sp. Y412MC10]|uniref:GNAT family N-acetyltransferase n=1 Tax=Geobacillus sp. (strain Y412MC10) TaxID=481743 RepID=UPI0011AB35AB|nr:GNAT family N-acetyltransferase [Paenibacillus sp. Y412MC10]
MLSTRPITSDDDAFQYELYISTRLEEITLWGWDEATAASFLHLQWLAQTKSYASQYPELNRQLVLVENRKAGRILISREDQAFHLIDIALLPAYQRQGHGASLILGLQREASQAGLPIQLSVAAGNQAKRLYERLGFRTSGTNGIYEQMEWRSSSL